MLNMISLEVAKWKRTRFLWVTVACTLIVPLLNLMVFSRSNNPVEWEEWSRQNFAMFTAMFGPLVCTLVGAQAISTEYQYGTWKVLLTSPYRRVEVYLAKAVIGMVWMVGLTMLVFGANRLLGPLLSPVGSAAEMEWAWIYLLGGIGLGTLVPTIHAVTLVSRNFFVSSGFGIGLTMAGFMMLNGKYASLFPTSAPVIWAHYLVKDFIFVREVVGQPWMWVGVSVATVLGGLAASSWWLKRADM